MPSIQKSLRIPDETVREIERIAAGSGKEFASVAKDLLEEALRSRKCPGIVFAQGPGGKRARVAGTGVEVWEIVAAFKSVSEDYSELRKVFHWMSDQQLKSALGYYALYPGEIDERLKANAELDKAEIFDRFPFLADFGKRE